MARRMNGEMLHWLDALYRDGSLAERSDARLLEQFLAASGAGSEAAFEVLVRRHGPLVHAVCRDVLQDAEAAADAFQATFLVLARRAATIRDRDHLASWLRRVARRVATRHRNALARSAAAERHMAVDVLRTASSPVDHTGLESAALVRAEIDRLPQVERLLLQLVYWQGKSYEEAAAEVSWPIGTVRSRLSRVRDRLRGRFARLGLAPLAAFASSAALSQSSSAAQVPESLIVQTVRVACLSAGGGSLGTEAGVVPASVAALVQGELTMMSMSTWKWVTVVLVVCGGMGTGAMALAQRRSSKHTDDPAVPPAILTTPTATVPAPAQARHEVRNLLANGDVEAGAGKSPEGWTTGARIPGVEYLWSRDAGHSGKASLCMKKTANRYFPIAQWSQTVKREGDLPRLKVWAWVKADHVTKAILDAQFVDAGGNRTHAWVVYIGPKEPDNPPFTHDWKRYQGVVEIPANTQQISVAPQVYGPGKVWFDDLGAEYTSDPAIDPIGS